MDLRDWDINDDWADYEHVLAPMGAGRIEAMVSWLVAWHCTNKEIAKIVSALREGEKTTALTVKRHIERLLARLHVRGRGAIARRVRRLVREHRALKAGRGRGRVVLGDEGARRIPRRDRAGSSDGSALSGRH